MMFYDAKSCSDVKSCIDREYHFGIEIIKEGETAPMQLAIQKQIQKSFKKPHARLLDENRVLENDVMYFPSSNATWF